jgi:hypothetical protein
MTPTPHALPQVHAPRPHLTVEQRLQKTWPQLEQRDPHAAHTPRSQCAHPPSTIRGPPAFMLAGTNAHTHACGGGCVTRT